MKAPPPAEKRKRRVRWHWTTGLHPWRRTLTPGLLTSLALVALLWLALLTTIVRAQNLAGSVRSVSYFTTCSISGLSTQALDPYFLTNATANPTGATTPCELMGGELSSVVAVRVNIKPERVSGGETLVFQLNALPPPFSEFADSANELTQPFDATIPNPICLTQEAGRNCTFVSNQLEFTFASSDLVALYFLQRDAAPYPYAYYWHQCTAQLSTPSGPYNARSAYGVPLQCSTMASNTAIPVYNPVNFTQCMASIVPNSGQILNSGSHLVCPTTAQMSFPPGVDPGIYPAPDFEQTGNSCGAVLCPSTLNNTAYDVGVPTTSGPICWLWRPTDPRPKPMLNAEIIARQGTSSDTSIIRLSSLQNGALQVGGPPNAPIIANVIGVELASSIVADDWNGGVLVCDTCPPQAHGTNQCKFGMVSDYSATGVMPSNMNDVYLQAGRNPWRDNLDRLSGVCNGNKCSNPQCHGVVCTVPTRACRQCLFQDDSVRTFWMTIDQLTLAEQWNGGGCNSNGMPADIFYTRPDVAEFACLSQLNATCIPGYNQASQGPRSGTITPCQIQQSWTYNLINQATTGDSQSYGLGMPADFNPADPQYRMLGNILVRDAKYGTGDQTGLDIIMYLSAAYLGETVSLANGKFGAAGMLCNAVSGSATTGIIEYTVTNTGASVGSYCVRAEFFLPPSTASQQYTVTNITTPPCFQVPAGATVQGPPIEGWRDDGPQGNDLVVQLTLVADVQMAYYPQGVVLAVTNISCNTLTPAQDVQLFQGSDIANIIQDKYRPNPDDYVCNWYGPDLNDVDYYYYCQWWQLFYCYQGKTWTWCFAAFLGRGFIIGLLLAMLLTSIFSTAAVYYGLKAKHKMDKVRKAQNNIAATRKEEAAKLRAQKREAQARAQQEVRRQRAAQPSTFDKALKYAPLLL